MDNTIQAHQKELCNKLWAMANALRGNMEAYEFKNYILGMIFYYYLSDKTEKYMVNLLKDDGIGYEEAWADPEYKEAVVEEALRDLGFVIEPQFLFRKMVKMVENRSFDIEFLQKAINSLMESTIGNDSQEDFDGLFSDMQLDSTKLGHTVKDRSAVMSKIISSLDEINFGVEDTKIDVLGNAYEYLIGQFAATAGKKAGEFYTPSGPAELLCRIACLGLSNVKDAADPTCGSGSLLLRLKNYANVRNYYGQELTSTTYNLARMNMILRGIPYRNFNIYNGDTLEHDYFGDKKFRVQVANPPYSAHWSADMRFMEDPRFNEYGKLAPKSKADFAFVQHMVYHMDEDGRAVVLLPHGVLFRGAAEEVIRKHLIQKLMCWMLLSGFRQTFSSAPEFLSVFSFSRESVTVIRIISCSLTLPKTLKPGRIRISYGSVILTKSLTHTSAVRILTSMLMWQRCRKLKKTDLTSIFHAMLTPLSRKRKLI